MSSRKAKLGLIGVSTVLTVTAVEFLLRLMGPLYPLYFGIETIPEIGDKYFRYSFATNYGRRDDWLNRFKESKTRKVYDQKLGWDVPGSARVRGRSYPVARNPARNRVVFIGDSYTHGDDVEADDTFAFLVGEMLDLDALNMGVSGYGIDQAVLKYLYHGADYRPDLVVLGIYRHDYHRVRLKFHALRKPVVKVDGNGFTVTDDHVEPPSVYANQLNLELSRQSYLLALLEASLGRLKEQIPAWHDEYYRETDTIVKSLLQRLEEILTENGASLLIVHIPRGDGFSSDRSIHEMLEYPASQHLLSIYEQLGVPYIDLRKEFLARATRSEVFHDYFVHRINGRDGTPLDDERKIGHLSPKGHLEVARLIAERICVLKILKPDCDRLGYRRGGEGPGQLVASWNFGNHGSKIVDRGPFMLHGTANNAVIFHENCGQDGCAEFDGENSKVQIRRPFDWHLGNDFQIEAWVKPTGKDYPPSQGIVGRKGVFTFALRSGRPAFWGYGLAPEGWHTSPHRLELESWHKVAVVCSGGELRILHNDLVIYGRTVGGTIRDATVGAVVGYGAGHFRGFLDAVSVRRRLVPESPVPDGRSM